METAQSLSCSPLEGEEPPWSWKTKLRAVQGTVGAHVMYRVFSLLEVW